MKWGYPNFLLFTWMEETQTWEMEEGKSRHLGRMPKEIKSDLKEGKCRVFADLDGRECCTQVEVVQRPSWRR